MIIMIIIIIIIIIILIIISPCEHVWIVSPGECLLQLVQLETREGCSVSTLLPSLRVIDLMIIPDLLSGLQIVRVLVLDLDLVILHVDIDLLVLLVRASEVPDVMMVISWTGYRHPNSDVAELVTRANI